MCLTSCSPLTFHFLQERQRRKKKKSNERGGAGGGGVARQRVEGERKKRGEEKWGAGELLLLLSPYLLSLSFPFSPSGSRRGNLRASPLPRRTFSRFTSLATGAAVFFLFKAQRRYSEDESKRVKVSNTDRRGFRGAAE